MSHIPESLIPNFGHFVELPHLILFRFRPPTFEKDNIRFCLVSNAGEKTNIPYFSSANVGKKDKFPIKRNLKAIEGEKKLKIMDS